jgi:hypothetical protein
VCDEGENKGRLRDGRKEGRTKFLIQTPQCVTDNKSLNPPCPEFLPAAQERIILTASHFEGLRADKGGK